MNICVFYVDSERPATTPQLHDTGILIISTVTSFTWIYQSVETIYQSVETIYQSVRTGRDLPVCTGGRTLTWDVGAGSKLGPIGSKWDQSGTLKIKVY